MDPLQESPTALWPDLEDEAPVGWLPAAQPTAAPADQVGAAPPAWPAPAATLLVREIQRLVPAQVGPPGRDRAFGPRPRDVKTYAPFK